MIYARQLLFLLKTTQMLFGVSNVRCEDWYILFLSFVILLLDF